MKGEQATGGALGVAEEGELTWVGGGRGNDGRRQRWATVKGGGQREEMEGVEVVGEGTDLGRVGGEGRILI